MTVIGSHQTLIKSGSGLGDDAKLFFGSDDDFSVEFDTGSQRLIFRDEARSNNMFTLDTGGNEVEIRRTLNLASQDIVSSAAIGAIADFNVEAIIASVGG